MVPWLPWLVKALPALVKHTQPWLGSEVGEVFEITPDFQVTMNDSVPHRSCFPPHLFISNIFNSKTSAFQTLCGLVLFFFCLEFLHRVSLQTGASSISTVVLPFILNVFLFCSLALPSFSVNEAVASLLTFFISWICSSLYTLAPPVTPWSWWNPLVRDGHERRLSWWTWLHGPGPHYTLTVSVGILVCVCVHPGSLSS